MDPGEDYERFAGHPPSTMPEVPSVNFATTRPSLKAWDRLPVNIQRDV